MKRVVIIGGGIAGLATAWSLREHQGDCPPFEIVLVERNPRFGGNIQTERVDGFLVEGGPDCFLSEKPWAMELCKRVGLEDKLLNTNDKNRKTFVLSGGKLHVLPEGVILMIPTKILPLATSSLISWPGKIRMAFDLFVPKRKEKGDESLGDFVRRRLGKEALDKIAEPLVAGVHAGDPETMSVRASFPKFVQLEEESGSLIRGMVRRMASAAAHRKPAPAGGAPKRKVTMFMTLRDGLTELIDTLSTRLKGMKDTVLKTGTAASSVEKAAGAGYRVNLVGGGSIEADAVVIAAPAWAASSMISAEDPELAKKLLTIPYVSTATVSIAFKRKDVSHPLDGFGFVVPRIEKRRIMAATWTSVKFAQRAPEDSVLLRCFVGGSKNAELVSLSDGEILKMVREELRDIMGIDAEPVLARVFKWRESMPQYTIGHEERIAWIDERLLGHPGLYLAGSAYHGIGISDSIRYGEVVAKRVLHQIAGHKGA
ncbi:MAG TPA: protoporphyrinogen oxidase [Deltaproteobacteria bacterium]|nr:MAG: protoporphyrinogen oxidase [Deltaproteobacteria bacterium GWA2_55_82]OGQ64835.1 MAG: protoporphyrinogen oxidase [Deltaproteobacteria bacterium RIFCSPLOWO2_02_FULL_55_12]OIJ73902.1 MAG: protoporphyrinogen oxidase [Deltaproteobacteria bacterium GWC2_55_46]HBG47360.1 protoporphyrinogen oxidase [Deltaproteobacteria bacterium]HCY09895.1 protoporphyrinogen oxidase [Deltaproteobacteria bacterium]